MVSDHTQENSYIETIFGLSQKYFVIKWTVDVEIEGRNKEHVFTLQIKI